MSEQMDQASKALRFIASQIVDAIENKEADFYMGRCDYYEPRIEAVADILRLSTRASESIWCEACRAYRAYSFEECPSLHRGHRKNG